ncbi:hypothetical protein [Paludisphaera mucosa]|uniref:Uncharacterized protein n=1 Tax=Paludisphaera mucosa TaxID=3030827 RepID=A0ABT6F5P9_9BACT|nr:hypothetical protein [Paludisphaera mucosa]MDG3002907.1 hypothetical protein [Paludisphaera mucosa]
MLRPHHRGFISLTLGLAAFTIPSATQGQTSTSLGDISSDPFAFYYAYYLPNQQMQAMRPRADDSINQAVQQRQYYAASQKPRLYDPISPYTDQPYDPLRPYSKQQGKERSANPYRFAQNPSNSDGTGPSLYYGRAAQYFPTLRAGRGPNANVASGGRRMGGGRRGGGMGGMGGGMGGMGGGMGGGMPGMPG